MFLIRGMRSGGRRGLSWHWIGLLGGVQVQVPASFLGVPRYRSVRVPSPSLYHLQRLTGLNKLRCLPRPFGGEVGGLLGVLFCFSWVGNPVGHIGRGFGH